MTDTDDARALFERAQQLFSQEDWNGAADAFGELMLHPGLTADAMPAIQWDLAVCYLRMGNRDLALQHFQAGGYSASDYATALSQQDRRDGEALYQRARDRYAAGDWNGAADLFAELIFHPGLPADSTGEVHWDMAMCFVRQGNRDLAIQHFQAGGYSETDYAPVFADQQRQEGQALYQRARDRYVAGDWNGAADLFAELMLHPGLPADQSGAVHWDLAMCFFQLGDDERGRQHMAAGGFGESDYQEAYEAVAASRVH